jgi:hypothetical protein
LFGCKDKQNYNGAPLKRKLNSGNIRDVGYTQKHCAGSKRSDEFK